MKKILPVLFLFLATIGANASDWIKISSDKTAPASINLVSSNINSSTVQFALNGFWKSEVETDRGLAWLIDVDGGASMLKKGAPDLPVFATSLIIPDKSAMKVEVISSEYTEIDNVLIAPSKGNFTRQIDPATVPYEYGKYYDTDAIFPGDISKLNTPYIVRDYRGQVLKIQPFQYNPVTHTLRVYYNVTVKVTEDGESSINTIDRTASAEKIARTFTNVYKRHFLNYSTGSRYDPIDEEGDMIIISYGDFMDEIQPFADWKIKKGISCSIVDVGEIGGASDIKQFIQTAYDDNGLTFVLLVGDAAQVPSSTVSDNDSDVDYSYVAGSDHYPDLFVGRFSAETETQVTTMVVRTLEYETDPVTDTAWYTKAIGIASSQGPGDDNEYDYEHIRNIADNKLIPFTYNYAYEFFDGSQGGEDDPGNPNPAMVGAAVDSGATIINYTGHGSSTSWGSSGFSNSNINTLTNTHKWPFIISVACVNGNFVNYTCFAEAWIRASDNGEPTGALATLMSTVNQSWDPPMCGQDEMNDILTEAYEANIKRTFGGITMNGCMEMNDAYGSAGTYETDYWTIFGDPSVVVRTAIPADMTVSHPASLPLGVTSVIVTCDADGGLAALTLDGDIIATAVVVDGEALLVFDALDEPGTADIVVTAFNYRPYISTIEIVPATGAYITYAGNVVNDVEGNDNGLMDYAEEIYLTVDLSNIGQEDANEVYAELSTTSSFVTLNTVGADYGTILAGDTSSVVDAFSFSVAEDVPDGELIEFMITAEDQAGRSVWESGFSIEAHAPILNYVSYSIDDPDGDGNGKIDPGESADVSITLANQGTSDAYNVIGQLSTESEYITVTDNQIEIGTLEEGTDTQVTFQISADGDTPQGYSATFTFEMLADYNISGSGEFFTIVGQKPVFVLNLAENSASSDSIANCMNTLQVGADFGTAMPEKTEIYRSIFVILGVYPDNYQLTEEQGDALASFLDYGGCIYMEGGDTWAYDDQTVVHPMFYIGGLDDGSDDLSVINGEPDGFLSGYSFVYNGNNNYIDRIEAKDGGTLLMSNDDPEYGVAVSFEGDNYKTVGASFSFAGLADEGGNKKDGVMAEMLNFFDIGFIWTDIDERSLNEIEVVAYPNPFNREVTFSFILEQNTDVSIDIFDLTGRIVNTLVNDELHNGNHRFTWDATDNNGIRMQPGIYFYSLRLGDQVLTKKLILAR